LILCLISQAENVAPEDDTFKKIQIRAAAEDLLHALQNPVLVRFAHMSADICRSMGVKEYYLSHLTAASKHSAPLATAQESSFIASAEEPVEQRVTLVAGVDVASAPKKSRAMQLFCIWFDYAVFLYRQRRILSVAIILALASVIAGLRLGDVTSMMVLVVCLPTLIAFLAHWKYWKSMTRDDSSYPVKWRIGFALFFAVACSLSLGFMLGDAAKAMNAGYYTYSDQAAIMIFAICGVGALLLGLFLWMFRVFLLFNLEEDPPIYFCGVRSVNAAQPYLYGLRVAFVVIMFVVFIMALLGVTGVINCQYLVICCSQRARTHAHSSRT
jgi:hypothetical protein